MTLIVRIGLIALEAVLVTIALVLLAVGLVRTAVAAAFALARR